MVGCSANKTKIFSRKRTIDDYVSLRSSFLTTSMIRLGIVGGRDYEDYEKFVKLVDAYVEEIGIPDVIVSGGATGVDTMAETYAKKRGIGMIVFRPLSEDGRDAYVMRNTRIVNYSTHILALPTHRSTGTYDTINKAKKSGRELKVIHV